MIRFKNLKIFPVASYSRTLLLGQLPICNLFIVSNKTHCIFMIWHFYYFFQAWILSNCQKTSNRILPILLECWNWACQISKWIQRRIKKNSRWSHWKNGRKAWNSRSSQKFLVHPKAPKLALLLSTLWPILCNIF